MNRLPERAPQIVSSAEKSERKCRKSLISLNLQKALSSKAEENMRFLCTKAMDAFDAGAEKRDIFFSFSAKWGECVLFSEEKIAKNGPFPTRVCVEIAQKMCISLKIC